MTTEYLLTEKTYASIERELDRANVFTKQYTADRDGELTVVGMRIGQRPNHVVAYFGDTVRRSAQGVYSVWRLTEVRPLPNLTWHTVSPDEETAAEALSYEMEQAQIRATCRCTDKKDDEYTLEVEEGNAIVVHVPCGKRPWFMFDDHNLSVSMSPQKIIVNEQTGCSGYECYSGSCDCGPEIYLKTPEGNW